MPSTLIGPVLTLDAALDGCAAGLVRQDGTAIEQARPGQRGAASVLPQLVVAVLDEAGLRAADLAAIAVTVGPGSFTGIRAALSLAHGIGLAAGLPVWGARVADAIRAGLDEGPPAWVAIEARTGRVFLDIDGPCGSIPIETVPRPDHPVRVAGPAGAAVSAHVRALGGTAEAIAVVRPWPAGIAAAARVARLAPQPLYLDSPVARPTKLRAAPGPQG